MISSVSHIHLYRSICRDVGNVCQVIGGINNSQAMNTDRAIRYADISALDSEITLRDLDSSATACPAGVGSADSQCNVAC
jgi:hypothetical protein